MHNLGESESFSGTILMFWSTMMMMMMKAHQVEGARGSPLLLQELVLSVKRVAPLGLSLQHVDIWWLVKIQQLFITQVSATFALTGQLTLTLLRVHTDINLLIQILCENTECSGNILKCRHKWACGPNLLKCEDFIEKTNISTKTKNTFEFQCKGIYMFSLISS